jgi:hypothetical protein
MLNILVRLTSERGSRPQGLEKSITLLACRRSRRAVGDLTSKASRNVGVSRRDWERHTEAAKKSGVHSKFSLLSSRVNYARERGHHGFINIER